MLTFLCHAYDCSIEETIMVVICVYMYQSLQLLIWFHIISTVIMSIVFDSERMKIKTSRQGNSNQQSEFLRNSKSDEERHTTRKYTFDIRAFTSVEKYLKGKNFGEGFHISWGNAWGE